MNKSRYKAFSLLELLLVLTLMGLLLVSGGSALLNYYASSIMDAELKGMTATLQRARQLAISNDSGSNYSVKFLTNTYVLFPGNTYSSTNPDNVVHTLDTNAVVSTTFSNDTITYKNFTGRTDVAGSLTLQAYHFTKVVTINSIGTVESIQ